MGRAGLGLSAVVSIGLAAVVTVASTDAAPLGQDAQPIEIVMSEYAFAPVEPIVVTGGSVLRIVNAGIRRHNLVLLVDGVDRASPAVRPGEVVEWDVQIERSGRYEFWCGEYRHLEKGMTGTLIVE